MVNLLTFGVAANLAATYRFARIRRAYHQANQRLPQWTSSAGPYRAEDGGDARSGGERQIQRGPRGLGVVIGLGVSDLDATFAYCKEVGREITCEPIDEARGERVSSCLDPFGYEWEVSHPIAGAEQEDGTAAVHASWFGSAR